MLILWNIRNIFCNIATLLEIIAEGDEVSSLHIHLFKSSLQDQI